MNLPGVIVDLPTLTSKDEDDLVKWGLPNDIDFIAASFVRKGSDVTNIRKASQGSLAFCICSPASAQGLAYPGGFVCFFWLVGEGGGGRGGVSDQQFCPPEVAHPC